MDADEQHVALDEGKVLLAATLSRNAGCGAGVLVDPQQVLFPVRPCERRVGAVLRLVVSGDDERRHREFPQLVTHPLEPVLVTGRATLEDVAHVNEELRGAVEVVVVEDLLNLGVLVVAVRRVARHRERDGDVGLRLRWGIGACGGSRLGTDERERERDQREGRARSDS